MSSAGLRILIVEDQFLIAKQLEMIVDYAGHRVVGIAATCEAACGLAKTEDPDIAFVDVSLADGPTGLDVASFIVEHCAAHVVFTTANRRRLPPDYCGAIGIVEKPFTRAGLIAALNYVAARIKNTCEMLSKPESLVLAPSFEARWVQGR